MLFKNFPFLIRGFLIFFLISSVIFSIGVIADSSANDTTLKFQTIIDGKLVDARLIGPGLPPPLWVFNTNLPDLTLESTKTLDPAVPTMTWSYGCAATSATMYYGYYDRNGYPDMYVGPTNGGVFPLTNAVWGSSSEGNGQCPLTASQKDLDNRTTYGHKDDYYYAYGSSTDPYYVNWTEHTPQDSIGDYMGTNQYINNLSTDGGTWFWNYNDGSPYFDPPDNKTQGKRDGIHGMKLFAESRGYLVTTNYNQYIYGYNGNTKGFTYDQYKAEIDAGYPVLIQVKGHTMLGVGYSGTDQVILHDTWDYSSHTMTWGGYYADMQHTGVGVLHLVPITITYNITAAAGAGGSISPSGNVTVPSGSNQTFTITASSGYSISDVQVDGNSVGGVSIYTFANVTSNHTISASFRLISVNYTIFASAGTGGSINPSGNVTVPSGSNQSFSITASSGYSISDVQVDSSNVGAVSSYTFTNVTSDHTISAIFSPNPVNYTIFASAGAGGTIIPSGNVTVSSGSNQSFSIAASSGYFISDVLVDSSSVGAVSSYTFTNVTSNHTISATFGLNPINYTIFASAGAGGTIIPSGNVTVPSGSNQSISVTASSGYFIFDVLVDSSSVGAVSSYTFTNVTSNHTISATFRPISVNYTIVASAGTGGTISPSGNVTVPSGSNQTFTITASSGYSISDVRVDSSSVGAVSSYTFTNVTSDHTISATFSSNPVNYTIFASAGTGGNIIPSGNVTVPSGSNQSFSITASSGYSISDVQVDSSSVGVVSSYTFTNVTSDHTISATFRPISVNYTIVASAGTGGSISPSGNVTVPSGSNQSFSITASGGYSISDVLVDSISVGAVSSYTFTNVTSNHMISASFRKIGGIHEINATADAYTIVYPRGIISYPEGSNKTYLTQSKPGSDLTDVLVDNESKGSIESWSFTNISSDHNILTTGGYTPGQVHVFFAVNQTGGQAPLAVQFTDKSVGNPMSWYWQFGDGDTSVSQNPLHLYQVPGVYSVTLRAVNNQSGGVCVWNNAIIVTD